MTTTLIRDADLVVAWDASEGRHAYLPGGSIAFRDGVLTFVVVGAIIGRLPSSRVGSRHGTVAGRQERLHEFTI